MSGITGMTEPSERPEFAGGAPRRGLFAASFFVLVANIAAGLFAVGTQIVTARALGPTGRGEYVLLVLIAVLGVTFGALGIPAGTVYFGAAQRFARRTIVAGNLFMSVLIGGAILTVGSVVAVLAPQAWLHVGRLPVIVALASIPCFLITSNLQAVFQADHDLFSMNLLSIAQTAIPFAFTAVAVVGLDAGLRGAIVAYALGALGTALIALGRTAAAIGTIPFEIPRGYIRAVVPYGVQSHFSYLAIFLTYRVDTLLVAALAGSAAVGYYSVAVVIAERVWLLSFAASVVLLPRIAGETDEAVRKNTTAGATRATLWLSIAIALLLLVGGHPLIRVLFSSAYGRSVGALNGLLVGIVALGTARILSNDLAARGRPILNAYVGYAALAVNIVANIILIPPYGISGAAWSSSISYTLAFVLLIAIYARQTNTPPWALVSPRRLVRDIAARRTRLERAGDAP